MTSIIATRRMIAVDSGVFSGDMHLGAINKLHRLTNIEIEPGVTADGWFTGCGGLGDVIANRNDLQTKGIMRAEGRSGDPSSAVFLTDSGRLFEVFSTDGWYELPEGLYYTAHGCGVREALALLSSGHSVEYTMRYLEKHCVWVAGPIRYVLAGSVTVGDAVSVDPSVSDPDLALEQALRERAV